MTTNESELPFRVLGFEYRRTSTEPSTQNAKPKSRNPKLSEFASLLDRALDANPNGSEAESSAASTGDSLAPNIVILPPPSVVIPFPVVLPADGDDSAMVMESPESWWSSVEELTVAQTSEPNNVKVIDFRQSAEAKIIRLPVAAPSNGKLGVRNAESPDSALQPALSLLEAWEETAVSQLPGDEGPPEEIAHLPETGSAAVGPPDKSKGFTKAIAHAGLPRIHTEPTGSVEATGISAAGQESGMDSMKNSGQGNAFAGSGQNSRNEFPPASHESVQAEVKATDISPRISAMDWQLGRPVVSFDRPSPTPAPLSPEQSAMVDRVSSLLLRETSLVRQYSSDSMAVVLRPDDGTELYVHFARRNGQIEATIRCDRGDVQQLGALWPQLQKSLAQQRVRLAPLQEGPSANLIFTHSAGSSGGGGGSQRHSPSDRQSMDEWSAPASSVPDRSHVRGRGGSRRRLTTSRPGWETWA